MAISPTRFSRVSIGWRDSAKSLVDLDPADTGPAASITGGVVFGNSGSQLNTISSTTASVDFGSVAAFESSSVLTVGVSGLTRGDTLIATLDANWSLAAGHRDLSIFASSSSTVGEANVWAVNSTLTAVNPAGVVVRFTRIAHPSYL